MSFKAEDSQEVTANIIFQMWKWKIKMLWSLEKFLWSANKNDLKTHDNIKKIAIGHGDNYKTGCLLDYPYFKKYYKLITIDLSKQQKLDTDPKAIQQINYTGSLSRAEGKTMFFIIEEAKEAVLIIQKEKL